VRGSDRTDGPTGDLRREVVALLRAAGCVFAEAEWDVLSESTGSAEEVRRLAAQRASGVPLEHVVGWAEFGGLRLAVAREVFVPRRRTELLARTAASLARPGQVVLDLCCGVGAVAAVIAATVPDLDIHAVDVSEAAIRCAARNLAMAGATVAVGDLYDALPSRLAGRVSVIAANAPYVPTDALAQMPTEARLHEPRVALDGGPDGLDLHRRIAAGAPHWLCSGGRLLIEVADSQHAAAARLCGDAGLDVSAIEDGEGTVVIVGRAGLASRD
jgi:release factor glutamine methyltransferase